jgi:drug/metabolite transporter (DMT)-like permease
MPTFKPTVYLALAIAVIILGSSAIFIRKAEAPGAVSSFYRMGIATVAMALPFLQNTSKHKANLTGDGVRVALLGGIFFSLDLTLWSTGVMLSGATNPTLLSNTAPLWVGLGAYLFFGEKQSGGFWFGVILSMIGATLILGQDMLRSVHFGVGSLLGLLSSFFYGAYYLTTQRGREKLDTLSYFWLTALSSSFVLFVFNLILGNRLTGYNTATYLNFLALGVVVQVIGWLILNYIQGYLPASIVAPTLLVQPVMTAIFAALLLGERFTIWHICGGIAVLTGVYLVHRSRWETQPTVPERSSQGPA